ncbi:MAG: hypothetical protein R3Y63_14040 [Eubacteriales bacterium]
MGLYDIQKGESPVSNFHAGNFPIAKETGVVQDGAEIRKYAVIATTPDGMEEVTAETLENVVGIAAEFSTEAGVVYYATGEYLESAILYDEAIDLEDLKTALRKINIYLS